MRLVDWQIASLQKRQNVIDPYEGALIRELPTGPAIAYGQARDGYVLRLSPTSAVTNFRAIADPKYLPKPEESMGLNFVPPQSCMMALTVESVALPRGYTARLELIPQYATCGLTMVPVELPGGGQPGRVLATLINPMASRVVLYHGEGFVKLIVSDEAPLLSRAEECGDAPEVPQRGGAGLTMTARGGDNAGA